MTILVATKAERMRESALLHAAQRGDERAIELLFREHRGAVAAQLTHMIGDPASVDDLVQEVFIAAFAALPGFRRDAQVGTWLYRIALNKSRNWWKAQQRRRHREREGHSTSQTEPAGPEEEVSKAHHLERLYEALRQLPHRYREAFVARHIQGMELVEASRHLGAPVSTVSYRARRAMAMLERALVEVEP